MYITKAKAAIKNVSSRHDRRDRWWGLLLNTAKNTREQIYLKIQGFQQQGSKFI